MSILCLEEKAFEEGKKSYPDFEEWMWQYIDETIVSNKFLDDNEKFRQMISYDCWKKYVMYNISHQVVCEIIKDMFISLHAFDLLDNSEYED